MTSVAARWTIISWVVGTSGCVGTNPDWDGSSSETRAESDSTATDSGDGDAGGSTSGPSYSTSDGDGGDATTGTNPWTCLQSGSTYCEHDGVRLCADLRSDPDHCGACFSACRIEGATCMFGLCVCEGRWNAACDGVCVRTKDDPRACGPDCVDCIGLFGPTSRCHNGSCEAGGDDGDD